MISAGDKQTSTVDLITSSAVEAKVTVCVYVVRACVGLIVVGTIWIRVRALRIAVSRPSENFEIFRTSFTPDEALPEVLRVMYAKLQVGCADTVAAFPVRADDDIGRIYGMVDEDLDDAVLEVLAECGRLVPPEELLHRMRLIVTVRDFVCFVAGCPRALNQVL